jgi:hypothetical protein
MSLLLIFKLVIVLTMNFLYVVAVNSTVSNESNYSKFGLTILVSLFKIIWGNIVVLKYFMAYLNDSYETASFRTSRIITWESQFNGVIFNFLVNLSLFNTILAPFIAFDPSCFLYALTSPPNVPVSYQYEACNFVYDTDRNRSVTCGASSIVTSTISYTPPFLYSCQCGSALLKDFGALFIYRSLIGAVIWPVILIVVKQAQEHLVETGQLHSRLCRLLTMVLPVYLQPCSFTAYYAQSSRPEETLPRPQQQEQQSGSNGLPVGSSHSSPLSSLTTTSNPSLVSTPSPSTATSSSIVPISIHNPMSAVVAGRLSFLRHSASDKLEEISLDREREEFPSSV